jgi:hypothetical protein
MFKDFGRRLQKDVSKIVKDRMKVNSEKMAHLTGVQTVKVFPPQPICFILLFLLLFSHFLNSLVQKDSTI